MSSVRLLLCLKILASVLIAVAANCPVSDALADSARRQEIEKRGVEIAKSLCGEDLGCRYLREGYANEEPEFRSIAFTSLALYIQQDLAPKLPNDSATRGKLAELQKLFDEHLALPDK